MAGSLRRFYHPALLYGISMLMPAASVVKLGGDFGAMGAAVHILIDDPGSVYAALFAALSVALQTFI